MNFEENNMVGDVVTTIDASPGDRIEFSPLPENPNNPFGLSGNNLTAARVLDYEVLSVMSNNNNEIQTYI